MKLRHQLRRLAAAVHRAAAAVERWREEVADYPSDADRWLR